MHEFDIDNWNRYTQYRWFSSFSNPTYSVSKEMDVTNVVKYAKGNKKSFFVCFLYILTKGLNSVEEMRLRYVNDKVILYDDINPAFTVMTDLGTFDNVRSKNYDNFTDFYNEAKEKIEKVKHEEKINKTYNDSNRYNEYYITCLPWIEFTGVTHPIPDDKESLSVPRICFSKFKEIDGKFILTLNITVNHAFVDGYPLAQVFINIQKLLDDTDSVLK